MSGSAAGGPVTATRGASGAGGSEGASVGSEGRPVGPGGPDGRPADRATVARLLRIAAPETWTLVASTLARTVSLLAGGAVLLVGGHAVGDRLAGRGLDVGRVAVTMAALAVLAGAARYAEQYAGHHVAFGLLARMRVDLYRALVPQAPAVVDADRTGRLLTVATRDVDRVEVFFAHTLAPAVTAVVVPTVGVVAGGVLAGPTGAVVLGVGVLVGLAASAWLGRRAGRRWAGRAGRARGELAQQVTDAVNGQAELLAFDAVERTAAAIDATGRRVAVAGERAAAWQAARAGVGLVWVWGTVLAATALLGGRVAAGMLDPAAWLTVALLPLALAAAVGGVEAFARDLPAALAAASGYLAALDRPAAVAEPAEPRPLTQVRGHLQVQGVTFGYGAAGPAAPALADVDLEVVPGGRIGLVGESGSGKSTLVALLQRVHDPQAGRVLLDGVDLRDLPLAQVRAAVTVVDQRPFLFRGTVRDNLRLAAPDIDDARLAQVCALVRLAPDPALPDGLDTRVGERGARLSGGQRQRLSLARGLLRGSPVLVLDEATSQQDPLTQQAITAALAGHPDVAVVVVAHRSAALAGVTRVYRLHDGRLLPDPSGA